MMPARVRALRGQVGLTPRARVRALRRHLGLTQQELANVIGRRLGRAVNRTTVARWELGQARPRPEVLSVLGAIWEDVQEQTIDLETERQPTDPPVMRPRIATDPSKRRQWWALGIALLCQRLGSQAAVAQAIREATGRATSQQRVSLWLLGLARPRADTLVAIGELVGGVAPEATSE